MKMIQIDKYRWISSDVVAELQHVPEYEHEGRTYPSEWVIVTKRGERISVKRSWHEVRDVDGQRKAVFTQPTEDPVYALLALE